MDKDVDDIRRAVAKLRGDAIDLVCDMAWSGHQFEDDNWVAALVALQDIANAFGALERRLDAAMQTSQHAGVASAR